VTAAGFRPFILNYRTRTGRERRITIGQFPDWKTAARDEAKALKQRIDRGGDPLADIEADRDAKTVADLRRPSAGPGAETPALQLSGPAALS
jgi:hypothetical protein